MASKQQLVNAFSCASWSYDTLRAYEEARELLEEQLKTTLTKPLNCFTTLPMEKATQSCFTPNKNLCHFNLSTLWSSKGQLHELCPKKFTHHTLPVATYA